MQPPPPAAASMTQLGLETFRTCSDPVLERMRNAARVFIADIESGAPPRWLTLWGTNGTGKTFLASLIVEAVRERLTVGLQATPTRPQGELMAPGGRRQRGPRVLRWAPLMEAYQGKQEITPKLDAARAASILLLDDIGAEHITPATLAKLSALLDARLGKWTVITSNLSPDGWKAIEPRISSRFIRGGSVHVQCDTLDFSTRRA